MPATSEILDSGFLDFLVFPEQVSVSERVNGNNQKGVLVVLDENVDGTLSGFLEKVLKSVGIELSNDALTLILTPEQHFSFTKMCQNIKVEKAVFFGLEPSRAGLNFNVKPFHPLKFGGRTFLFANKLSEIQNTPSLKRPLWEGLKVVFSKQ